MLVNDINQEKYATQITERKKYIHQKQARLEGSSCRHVGIALLAAAFTPTTVFVALDPFSTEEDNFLLLPLLQVDNLDDTAKKGEGETVYQDFTPIQIDQRQRICSLSFLPWGEVNTEKMI